MIAEIPEEWVVRKLKSLNPHWETGKIDSEVIPPKRRKYFNLFFPLASQFDVQRAVVMMGPRRVGKTVMLHHAIQSFIDAGVDPKQIAYFPLDILLEYKNRLENLIELYLRIHPNGHSRQRVIIIDEIQYMKDWAIQLKGLVDTSKNTKFIVSGSAAGALRMQSMESGAGRFTDFLLPPLSFYEYLDLLDIAGKCFEYDVKYDEINIKDIEYANKEFINYINYGGFPEAVTNKNIRENPERYIREDIIDKVLLRDLPSLYGISDTQELNRLFKQITFQTGNEVSLDELSKNSKVTRQTISKYLEYLEAAFLIKKIYRVNDSGRRFKRENYFKVYLTNPSMFSAMWGLVSPNDSDTLGRLVETAFFSQLTHEPSVILKCHYVKMKRGEVDMVLQDEKQALNFCVEVKWRDGLMTGKTGELRGLLEFCRLNKIEKPIVTSKTDNAIKVISGLQMQFIPAAVMCYFLGELIIKKKLKDIFSLLKSSS